jgi:hypothetical protein
MVGMEAVAPNGIVTVEVTASTVVILCVGIVDPPPEVGFASLRDACVGCSPAFAGLLI